MSKVRDAAQAAVAAFELHGYSPLTIGAIWALRDALAEERLAESEDKCPCKRCDYSCGNRRKGEK